MRFEVKFYETTDGKKPVEDFLLSLENKMHPEMQRYRCAGLRGKYA